MPVVDFLLFKMDIVHMEIEGLLLLLFGNKIWGYLTIENRFRFLLASSVTKKTTTKEQSRP